MSARRFTVDPVTDAAYFPIAPSIGGGAVMENVVIERDGGTVILDFDEDGKLLGVEILGASRLLTAQAVADADE